MSDDETTDQEPADGGEKISVGTIRGIVEDILSKKDGDTGTRRAGRRVVESRLDRDTEIADAVEQAVKQLKADEERHRKDSEAAETIKALKEKVMDVPPVERSKLHRFMGWGD